MSEQKEFDPEMRGSLWSEKERTNEKAPVATGTVQISGVELRVAMWAPRVAKGNGKRAGDKYWPISVEYKQGTKFVLAKVRPANIVVTGAAAAAASDGEAAAGAEVPAPDGGPIEDMPF